MYILKKDKMIYNTYSNDKQQLPTASVPIYSAEAATFTFLLFTSMFPNNIVISKFSILDNLKFLQ